MMPPAELYPALALGTGLAGALGLGLGRRTPARAAGAARALLLLAVAAALATLAVRPVAAGALLRFDGAAVLWQALFLAAAVPLALLMPMASELPAALAAAALLGMTLLASANHLVLLFIGLELMSLPSYLLVYLLRSQDAAGDAAERRVALEAALKYFFAGSAGSALFLFGASVFYGLTGTLAMDPLGMDSPRLELALAFMGAGALFKLGAAPLHFWLPDVYEASAPELAAFFSTAVKAAGLLFLLRVLALLPPAAAGLASALPALAVATMTLGNLLALRQTSLQRLLAYSSIAHVGYLLVGVWAWSASRRAGGPLPAPASVYVYAAAYLFMSTGAFVALRLGGLRTRAQLAGFAQRRPALAAFLALMLLSLASVPPTGGFLAKFFVLWDALKSGGGWLAAVAAANSVVGLGYYFALIRDLYLQGPTLDTSPDPGPLPTRARLILAGCAAPTLLLGLWPGAWRLAAELLSR
ncbi:MAG: NADH-quinone oxidoreductase subunit N [Elusimicrobia bacterium]|nr:NADH-quinone oxidoreductase subunit N [Elusimicrobiota bacterium]